MVENTVSKNIPQKYLFFVVQKKGPMAGLQWFNDYVRADPGLH